jgi:hypothetical protein
MPPKYKPITSLAQSKELAEILKKPKGKTASKEPCDPTAAPIGKNAKTATSPPATGPATVHPLPAVEPYFDVYYVTMPGCVGWHWMLWSGKGSKILAGHVGPNLKTKELAWLAVDVFKLLVAKAKVQTKEESN